MKVFGLALLAVALMVGVALLYSALSSPFLRKVDSLNPNAIAAINIRFNQPGFDSDIVNITAPDDVRKVVDWLSTSKSASSLDSHIPICCQLTVIDEAGKEDHFAISHPGSRHYVTVRDGNGIRTLPVFPVPIDP